MVMGPRLLLHVRRVRGHGAVVGPARKPRRIAVCLALHLNVWRRGAGRRGRLHAPAAQRGRCQGAEAAVAVDNLPGLARRGGRPQEGLGDRLGRPVGSGQVGAAGVAEAARHGRRLVLLRLVLLRQSPAAGQDPRPDPSGRHGRRRVGKHQPRHCRHFRRAVRDPALPVGRRPLAAVLGLFLRRGLLPADWAPVAGADRQHQRHPARDLLHPVRQLLDPQHHYLRDVRAGVQALHTRHLERPLRRRRQSRRDHWRDGIHQDVRGLRRQDRRRSPTVHQRRRAARDVHLVRGGVRRHVLHHLRRRSRANGREEQEVEEKVKGGGTDKVLRIGYVTVCGM
mmetsp:Transcript_3426/g.10044  ORF Transcript_3426/g.10044 Transcript_3426/m.10044 type:complete len:338 (+) Transcript_3426:208-1221(+)